MNDEERLAEIRLVLEDLNELSKDHVLLIEGQKDKRTLGSLGIEGKMFMIQSEGGPTKAAEFVAENGNKAVILTDWDKRGGIIAKELERLLSSLCVEYDTAIRKKLSTLSKKYIKDVESLDSLIERLSVRTIGIKGME